jgi:hypothetical protein
MMLRELDTVVLEHDLPEHGLRRGDLGAVVQAYGATTVEVEFVRASGQTQALVQLPMTAVRALRDADLPAVRTVEPRRGAA